MEHNFFSMTVDPALYSFRLKEAQTVIVNYTAWDIKGKKIVLVDSISIPPTLLYALSNVHELVRQAEAAAKHNASSIPSETLQTAAA